MDSMKQYLLSVIFAAIVIGIAQGIVGKKTQHKPAVCLLTGLFFLLTVLSPLKTANWHQYFGYFDEINLESEAEATSGYLVAQTEMERIITEQTESYIYDKATAMGVELDVTVTLEIVDSLPVPIAVKLEGSISPYDKAKMKEIIKNDIGIPEDQQEWK